jgi:hypothetical protein
MKWVWMTTALALSVLVLLGPAGLAVADGDDDHEDVSAHALAFQSVMVGLGQVPPVASIGRGLGSYLVTSNSATLYYSLQAVDASSTITMAHIHLGVPGQNGDVVVNLCGAGSAPACATSGVIATGTISASNLVGPLAGHPLGDLIVAMTAGGTYTNVHTTTFPDGELRGQVVLVGAAGDDDHGNGDNDQGENNQGGDHDDQGEDED